MLPNKSGKTGGTSMLNLMRTFLLLSTILVIGCASGPSGKSFDSPIGEWNEEWEMPETRGADWRLQKVTIIDETRGTFTSHATTGRIQFYAIDDQGRWMGHWVQILSSAPCVEEKDGSRYWGVNIYQFNDNYSEYQGTWDNCGEGHKYRTKGYR